MYLFLDVVSMEFFIHCFQLWLPSLSVSLGLTFLPSLRVEGGEQLPFLTSGPCTPPTPNSLTRTFSSRERGQRSREMDAARGLGDSPV